MGGLGGVGVVMFVDVWFGWRWAGFGWYFWLVYGGTWDWFGGK